jgi:hypothetical protein
VRDGFLSPELVVLWPAGAPGAIGSEAADVPRRRISSAPMESIRRRDGHLSRGRLQDVDDLLRGRRHRPLAQLIRRGGFCPELPDRPRYHYPAPLLDVQRALRLIRANAGRFGVRADRIGVIGFSAGGHLASAALTQRLRVTSDTPPTFLMHTVEDAAC